MQLAQSESHSKALISRINIDLLVLQRCPSSFIILKEENKYTLKEYLSYSDQSQSKMRYKNDTLRKNRSQIKEFVKCIVFHPILQQIFSLC